MVRCFCSIVLSFHIIIILKCVNMNFARQQKQRVKLGWMLWNKPGRENNFNSKQMKIELTWLNFNFCVSFNKLLLQKEELEQRHLHLLQVVESEMTAKWQYTQQCEELATEIKKLRAEVIYYWRTIYVIIIFFYL